MLSNILKLFSMFRKTRNILLDIMYLALSLIVAVILYTNIELFNSYSFFNIRLGSFLLIIASFFVLKFSWAFLSFFLRGYRGLGIVIKFIIMAGIIALALYILYNPDILSTVKDGLDTINTTKFNPVQNATNSSG